jgi:hypothetical protein
MVWAEHAWGGDEAVGVRPRRPAGHPGGDRFGQLLGPDEPGDLAVRLRHGADRRQDAGDLADQPVDAVSLAAVDHDRRPRRR